jgi:hypothetical protein
MAWRNAAATLHAPPSQDPQDRRARQLRWQRGQCGQRAGVCPLEVIEDEREGAVERGGLQRALELMQHPVAQIGLGADRSRHLGLADRRIAVQRRGEQRSKRHCLLALEPLTEQSAHTDAPRHRQRFDQQTALPDPRRPVDQQHTGPTGSSRGEALADDVQLRIAPPEDGPHSARWPRPATDHTIVRWASRRSRRMLSAT